MSTEMSLIEVPIETLAEMAAEKAALVEQHGRKTVQAAIDCGRYLTEIKSRLGHGEWLPWLEENWPQSQSRAYQYMKLANFHNCTNLDLAECANVHSALKLIGEAEEAAGTKRTRKVPEPAPEVIDNRPAPPVSSGVIRNENPPTPAPPTRLERPAWLADPDEMGMPDVDAMPQLPKTNTHHTSANRRTPDARETDRVGLVSPDDPRTVQDGHWYAWSEERNRLLPVSDEDILRRADEIRGQMIVEHAVTTTPVVEPTKDSVSSKPGKVPTAQQLTTAVGDRVHDGDWQDLWRGKLEKAVEAWGRYKQSLTGKAKVRSMESWEAALTRIETVAHDRGVDAVCDMIQKAIANGWQGWEHETNGSRGGSRISTAVRSNRNWDEEIPEWKPTE